MPQVVQWPMAVPGPQAPTDDPVLTTGRERLASGELVVLPTECGYVVAAKGLDANAVSRLAVLTPESALRIAVRNEADAVERLPSLGEVGRRLARRGWPGPLVLVGPAGDVERLPEVVRRLVSRDG